VKIIIMAWVLSNDDDVSVSVLECDASNSCHHGVQPALADTANDAVVALLTPRWAPAVPDFPILLRAVDAEPDNSNSVVKARRVAKEFPRVCNTTVVPLHWASVDADGEGPELDQCCCDLVLISADGLPPCNECLLLRGGGHALIIAPFVCLYA